MTDTHCKRAVTRLITLLLSLFTLPGLAGCRGSLYGDQLTIPGTTIGVDPLLLVVGFLVFGLLGPIVTLVILALLLPYIFPPAFKIRVGGMTIELWESRRRYPLVSRADALIVPVAPDLKMVFGAAKLARDRGANRVQYAANKVAPLPPGEAFIGEGARYLYRFTALAVIFDEQKRTTPELMRRALRRAIEQLLREEHVGSIMVPDMTENLLAQPNWITDELRLQTAHQTARMMLEALLSCRDLIPVAKIWVWDPANTQAFIDELERLEELEASGGSALTPDREVENEAQERTAVYG